MIGKVTNLYIATDKGILMESTYSVKAEPGRGLIGDRYADGNGSWSKAGNKIRHVSLIDLYDIAVANKIHGTNFSPADTRRNIVTKDIELNELINKEFQIGVVRMIGRSLCEPCARPSHLLNTDQDFKQTFENRGGLRAEVLTGGIIAVGATILIQ